MDGANIVSDAAAVVPGGSQTQSVLGENTNVNNENQNANALPALAVKVVPDATGNEENYSKLARARLLTSPHSPKFCRLIPNHANKKARSPNNGRRA